jgi:hypothetical protein
MGPIVLDRHSQFKQALLAFFFLRASVACPPATWARAKTLFLLRPLVSFAMVALMGVLGGLVEDSGDVL